MGGRLSHTAQVVSTAQREALDALIKAAQLAVKQERLEEAIRLYRQARTLAEPMPPVEASNMIKEIATVFRNQGQLPEALAAYQELQRHAQAHGLLNREAIARISQGMILATQGQVEPARAAVQAGLTLQSSVNDTPALTECLMTSGFVYLKLGEYQEALHCFQRAEPLTTGLYPLTYQANAYSQTGQYQKALELLFRTFKLNEIHEPSRAIADLSEIGMIYYKQGAIATATLYLQEALRRAQSTGNHEAALQLLNLLGGLAEDHGELAQKSDYLQRALAIAQAHDFPRSEVTAQATLGLVWARLRNRERAQKALDAALQKARALHFPIEEQFALAYQAAAYQELGELPTARTLFAKLATLAQSNAGQRAEALDAQARVCLQLRELPAARACAQQARALSQQLGDRPLEAKTLALLGKLEHQMGSRRAAERAYQQALTLAEQLRADAGQGMSGQGVFFETLQDSYRGYLTLLLEQRRATEGFQVAQKMKARGLLEVMAAGHVNLSRELTSEEQDKERRLQKRCELLAEAMVREAALNVPGSKKRFTALKSELGGAERELAAFQDQLYTKYPQLMQRRGTTNPSLGELCQHLPTTAALLEFAPLDNEGMALFVVTRDARGQIEVSATRLATPTKELEQHIAVLRAACTSPKKPWQAAARALYQALLAPVASHLRGKTQLIICPDRALWDVPFAVLTNSQGHPLLERFALSYAGSATIWHAAQTAPRKPSASPKLLVVANPEFDAEKRFESGPHVPGQRPITVPDRPLTVPDRPITVPDRDLFVPRGTRLVDLPGTQREADALARCFPSATVYTRARAQESVVKQTASQFQRIHLASHAFVNDAAPLLSSIVLANPTPGSGDDGFLTARELFELDLAGVELVVLSACNTARGATQGGEGVIGLTWALFAAGCPTQVLSQWAVDDSSTATLMIRFYDGLAKGVGKSESLRQAALGVRKASKYAHPYFWAPFVLLGDPR